MCRDRTAPSRAVALALAVGAPDLPRLHAMIDPSFTPIHLVEDARCIVAGTLGEGGARDRWRLNDLRALKGDIPDATDFSLALRNSKEARRARAFLAVRNGEPAILFTGLNRGEEAAYMLAATVWVKLVSGLDGGPWQVVGFGDLRMLKTYTGSADKLVRMTRYILSDAEADVPVSAGVEWLSEASIVLDRPISGLAVLSRPPLREGQGNDFDDGDGQLLVFSPAGDRLLVYHAGSNTLEDRTGPGGMGSASSRWALVDLSGDGLADLVSWDGDTLCAWLRDRDGRSGLHAKVGDLKWSRGCFGLTPLGLREENSIGLLLASDWPYLLSWQGTEWAVAALPGDPTDHPVPDTAAPCVVADWNDDGHADVLQLRDGGALLWTGGRTGFSRPEPWGIRSDGGVVSWAAGDYDTDGRLDLFVSARRGCELWENTRTGVFLPAIVSAGSLQDKAMPGAAECLATDLNHDGRPDLALLYESGHFLYYFNRGYGCLADQGEVQLAAKRTNLDPVRTPGLLRASGGDLNHDGSTDLAVAYRDGRVQCFLNRRFDEPEILIRLPRGRAGPVTVSVWQGDEHAFCVGTHLVTGHDPPTHATLRKRSRCTVRWRWPGGPPRALHVKAGSEVVLPRD